MKKKKIHLAIGDVHGCWQELEILLRAMGQKYDLASPDVQMVFLGDYIDRGDSSVRVINRLWTLKQSFPTTIFLKGNHELLFLENGYREENDLPLRLDVNMDEFFKSLKPYWKTEDFLFIHGGPMNETSPLDEMSEEEMLWNYDPSPRGWQGRLVVVGHCQTESVVRQDKLIRVDTGCCFGGRLSCAVLGFNGAEGSGLIEVLDVPRMTSKEDSI